MENDDMPEPLGPLMMQGKGCLNPRSSLMPHLAVYPKPLLNIPEGNGRVLTEAPTLQEKDTVNRIPRLCDYINSTVRHLALSFALGINCDSFCNVPSQYQGLNDVEIDRVRGALLSVIPRGLNTVFRLPVSSSTIL